MVRVHSLASGPILRLNQPIPCMGQAACPSSFCWHRFLRLHCRRMDQEDILGEHMEQVKEQLKQWTREHDAVIAEKVEGLKITTEHFSAGVEGRTTAWNRYFYNDPDWGMIEIPSYNEPKHFFRALEKWRKESTNRYWVIESSYGADGEMACYLINTKEGIRVNEYGKDAPAWALYKAVVDEV
jgi:hypothetical protein